MKQTASIVAAALLCAVGLFGQTYQDGQFTAMVLSRPICDLPPTSGEACTSQGDMVMVLITMDGSVTTVSAQLGNEPYLFGFEVQLPYTLNGAQLVAVSNCLAYAGTATPLGMAARYGTAFFSIPPGALIGTPQITAVIKLAASHF